jgi:hypothetical protein
MRIAIEQFMTDTLRAVDWGEKQPVSWRLHWKPSIRPKQSTSISGDRETGLIWVIDPSTCPNSQRVFLVGAGKAGAPMAQAVLESLGERVDGGLVIVKDGYGPDTDHLAAMGVEICEAGHPIPDERGRQGTLKIFKLLKR